MENMELGARDALSYCPILGMQGFARRVNFPRDLLNVRG
jgi:hypothetical protein